jgi:hypothetical protein
VIYLPPKRDVEGLRHAAETNYTVSLLWPELKPSRDHPGYVDYPGRSWISWEITIQTSYGPGIDPTMQSAYGRGTTRRDVLAGDTSLGFHEYKHAEYPILRVRSIPLPFLRGRFFETPGPVLKTRATEELQRLQAARQQFHSELIAESSLFVDFSEVMLPTGVRFDLSLMIDPPLIEREAHEESKIRERRR